MVYNSGFYNFSEEHKHNDSIPEWMDDQFFANLSGKATKKNDLEKVASLFNQSVNEHENGHICQNCKNHLREDEVLFCRRCIQDCLK